MRQGTDRGVGDDLLDDRVIAMLAFGLQHRDVAGDEHRVVAPYVEQPVLTGSGFRIEALDPPHDQPTVHVLVFRARCEGRVPDLSDLSVGDQVASLGVYKGIRVVDRRPRGVGNPAGRDSHRRIGGP